MEAAGTLTKSAICSECSQQLPTNPGNVWPSANDQQLAGMGLDYSTLRNTPWKATGHLGEQED